MVLKYLFLKEPYLEKKKKVKKKIIRNKKFSASSGDD